MADPGGSAIALVGKYLASKGLPYTAENVRRALQMNASNPGTVPQLVNGDAGTSSDPASDNGPGAKTKPRPVASTAQSRPMPVSPIPPQSKQPSALTSDSASGQVGAQAAPQLPQQPPQGGNMLTNLIEAILGGGAGALPGLLGGKPAGVGAEPIGNTPIPPTGRVMDVPGAAIGGPQPQQLLSGSQAAQPQPPLQIAQQLKLGSPPAAQVPSGGGQPPQLPSPPQQLALPAPQAPQQQEPLMNLLGDAHGEPAQLQHMATSTGATGIQGGGIPPPQMFDATNLPHAQPGINMLDWSKILGEVKPLLSHLKP